jgi:hypothetical protein
VAKEMPRAAKKLYDTIGKTFSGLDSMTLDMGDYNQGIGLHGMKISIQCEHFNPFRILPNLESEEYGDGVTSNRSYTEICNEWFATFTDPVLRTWAALVQNKKELPKDLLVNGAVDQIMNAQDSTQLIFCLEKLRDLARGGARVDQLSLMKYIKQKRKDVGDGMWDKNVARSFGEVLQAVKSSQVVVS